MDEFLSKFAADRDSCANSCALLLILFAIAAITAFIAIEKFFY